MKLRPWGEINLVWIDWSREYLEMGSMYRHQSRPYFDDYELLQKNKDIDPVAERILSEFHNFLITRRLKG